MVNLRRTWPAWSAGLASVALVASVPNVSYAAFPGGDGRLVYADNGIVVAQVLADHSTLVETRLTTGHDVNPRWFSTGRRIVYNTTGGAIRTIAPDGSGGRVVVADRDYQPAPSPPLSSGTVRILFVHVPRGQGGDIWSVTSTGTGLQRITTDGAASCGNSWPTWSPSGRYVAWVHQARTSGGTCGVISVVLLDRQTNKRTVIVDRVDPASGFDVAPAAGRLSFTSDDKSLVYPAEARSCVRLWGSYDIATRSVSAYDFYECEGDPEVWAVAPEPSGGLATTASYFNPDGPSPFCLRWSGGRACTLDDDQRPPFPFDGVDVQPVP